MLGNCKLMISRNISIFFQCHHKSKSNAIFVHEIGLFNLLEKLFEKNLFKDIKYLKTELLTFNFIEKFVVSN